MDNESVIFPIHYREAEMPKAPINKRFKIKTPSSIILLAIGVALTGAFAFTREQYKPVIDATNFQAKIDNPYFPLVPGTVWRYEERAGGETTESKITVMSETRAIMGVRCVTVHDLVTQNGLVKEDTWEWYAQDKEGTVWYFGDATKEYKAGGGVSTEGSWEAGVNGAQPGIILPAKAEPGRPYRQSYLAGRAEDMGQIIGTDQVVTVPAGTFSPCLVTKEWSLLESGTERKWYAGGIGVVQTQATGGDVSRLMSIKRP